MGFDDLAETRRTEQERSRLKFQSQAGILYQKGNLSVFEGKYGATNEGIHGKNGMEVRRPVYPRLGKTLENDVRFPQKKNPGRIRGSIGKPIS